MTRARDLGIPFEGQPGPLNAITDVAGVEVGHVTLIAGEGKLTVGKGPVRTGVTAVLPRGKTGAPVFAGWYSLNGNGEMTGTTWVEESGFLEGPSCSPIPTAWAWCGTRWWPGYWSNAAPTLRPRTFSGACPWSRKPMTAA